MPAYLLRGLILGAAAAAQPGPLQAFLLSITVRNGWQRALPAAFAPLISDGPILILVLFILARLPDYLLAVLQAAGGVFLLYLAWGAWQVFRTVPTPSTEPAGNQPQTHVLKAALMNALSPAPYLFWATIAGPILIEGWRQSPVHGLAFLIGFYAALIGGLMLFIVVFGKAGSLDPRINRGLGAFSAVALLAFGLYQFTSGIGKLIVSMAWSPTISL
jgi:threonine/homoserine/homoserine lactone efflux protein